MEREYLQKSPNVSGISLLLLVFVPNWMGGQVAQVGDHLSCDEGNGQERKADQQGTPAMPEMCAEFPVCPHHPVFEMMPDGRSDLPGLIS